MRFFSLSGNQLAARHHTLSHTLFSYVVIEKNQLFIGFYINFFPISSNNFLLQLCSNWQHFFDPESGISTYYLGVSSVHNVSVTDIANLTKISRGLHKTCVPIDTTHPLEHGKT